MLRLKILSLFLICSLLFVGYSLYAKELTREARIILVKGDVKVRKAEKTVWIEAKVDMVLSAGDTMKTGKTSALELSFDKEHKNVIRLEENSTAILRDQMLRQIELPEGRIRSVVKSLKKGSSFEIRTPTVVAGARGSGWDVEAGPKTDNVKALEDEIFVQSFNEEGNLIREILLREGWQVLIDRFQGPGEIFELSDLDKSDWSTWKDDLNTRVETERTGAGEDRSQDFQNVQNIEETIQSQEDFKEQVFENQDTTKIEDRISKPEETTSGETGGGYEMP